MEELREEDSNSPLPEVKKDKACQDDHLVVGQEAKAADKQVGFDDDQNMEG